MLGAHVCKGVSLWEVPKQLSASPERPGDPNPHSPEVGPSAHHWGLQVKLLP